MVWCQVSQLASPPGDMFFIELLGRKGPLDICDNYDLDKMIDLESNGVKQGDNIPEASRVDLLDVKIRSRESKVELRYHRPGDMLHSKKDCDKWESKSYY